MTSISAGQSPSSTSSLSGVTPTSTNAEKLKKRRGRSGCITCRIRRIKCDEEKPNCLKCTSTGRKCDGYTNNVLQPSGSNGQSRPQSMTLTVRDSGLGSSSPLVKASPQDIRLFKVFYEQCIPTIPGHFHSVVWSFLIPQLGNTQPAVYHAMLAIAALQEETVRAGKPIEDLKSVTPLDDNPAVNCAVKHYTAALRELQNHMNSGIPSQTVVLTTCILFVCLEALRGQKDAAMSHIENGLKILHGLGHRSSDSISDIPGYLSAGFGRLSLLLMPTEDPQDLRKNKESLIVDRKIFADTPESLDFVTVEEARGALSPLLSEAVRLVVSELSSTGFTYQGPDMAVTARVQLDTQIQQWSAAFDRFMLSQPESLQAGYEVLRGFAKIASIRLWASLYPEGASLDFLDADFEEFLDVEERCLNLQGWNTAPTNANTPPIFTMDLGTIGPLMFAACKCSKRRLRMRALEMLERAPRREALWSSEASAKTARQVNMMYDSMMIT